MRRPIVLLLLGATASLGGACGPSDRDLRAAVSASLAVDPGTRHAAIDVAVDAGVVRLSGGTNTRQEQVRAVEVTRAVPGVDDVVAEMRISDAAIAEGVRRAFAADPEIGGIAIAIEVSNGLVLLSSADTEARHRARAVKIASAIEGVTRVGDLMR